MSVYPFIGLGTVINIVAILGGGLLGLLGKRIIKKAYEETLLQAVGACVMVIGLWGTISSGLTIVDGKLEAHGLLMMIISFALGTVLGEALGIEKQIAILGAWLKRISGSQNDSRFLDSFLTASFTVCIGAMAVVGSIQDALLHDVSTLSAKACLDFFIVMIMTASMGKGAIFSALPVGVFQGLITLLATLLEPVMTEAALSNIGMTGALMIFLVGVNLVFDKHIRIANMLPTLVVAVLWALLFE